MKSLQQVHFPVSTLHLPPVFAHLGSHGGGKGGCFVQPGFLKIKNNNNKNNNNKNNKSWIF